MSYHVDVMDARSSRIMLIPPEQAAEEFGYEKEDGEVGPVLVFDMPGNQQAVVLTGYKLDFERVLNRIEYLVNNYSDAE